ncbi:MAG: acyl--CoA ligase [Rhodospirillales bacterium]|nr:acyl--CoA ligase [Rhodospirillales bacterium]
MSDTILARLEARAPAARAIGAPGRPWLDTRALLALAAETRARLAAVGIGRGDRLAIVLPNGPEMAAAFVSVAAATCAAPLNPAYRDEEFSFYLSDLKPKALLIQTGLGSPARAVAARLGIPLIELSPEPEGPAGLFRLDTSALSPAAPAQDGPVTPADAALVLHTSGTTARPKIVPLSNANLAASARHIGSTLALGPADACLNIMPLFHIHGLIGATLSSLAAGAGVSCTSGFNAIRFLSQAEDVRPTWYSAVPTMHQAILARAEREKERARALNLRFIRSSSSSLPRQVMAALEEVFGCPVIESYGMTEASHQMTSNPLPPRPRKPGSVGPAAGPEVAIMDGSGGLLPPGESGEVVIRGPNVTKGYAENPEANAKSFTDGWFRTGDEGRLDQEGYLWLTGRIKEIINRAGEKISPLEVDAILMDHPAVAQVVTFALPHTLLGEEVAAAVVLRERFSTTEGELREFCSTRLSAYKVPRKILFMKEIPKGATGKLQRIGLAQKLGLAG